MPVLSRVDTVMTGSSGSPYFCSLNFLWEMGAAGDLVNLVHDFWSDVATALHNNLQIKVQGEVTRVEDTTGEVLGVDAVTAPATVAGAVSGAVLPTQIQALLKWNTGVYVGGRSIQGRTFIPSIPATASNGALLGPQQALFQASGNQLIADAGLITPLVVWRRPREASPTLPARPGQSATVASATANQSFSTLRSRKE